MQKEQKLKVFYDGGCPICTREIGFYQKRSCAENIEWVNLNEASDDFVHPGLSREKALARFHVATPDGELLSGGTAFARMWQALPAFRLFGHIFRLWPLNLLLDIAYDKFLVLRPRIQKWFS